jgi:hypothetical protein
VAEESDPARQEPKRATNGKPAQELTPEEVFAEGARMAKRRSSRKGWQTPGTRCLYVCVAWYRAPELDPESVLSRIRKIVTDARARVVTAQTAFEADADDNEDPTKSFSDMLIEAANPRAVWDGLKALLDDPRVGTGLRRSSIMGCDVPNRNLGIVGRSQALLLTHYDPSEQLDEFR